MQVITPITIDLTRPGFPPVVDAKQGDGDTRCILAHITDAGVPWQVPAGVIGIVGIQKPDGKECWYEYLPDGSPAVALSGNTAMFALAPAALEAAGEGFGDVSLYNAAKQRLTTFSFRLHIERAAATEGEITSSDYYNILTREIAAVLNAASSIAGMEVTYEVLPAGSAPSVSKVWEGSDLTLHFGLAPGEKGDAGVSFAINSTTTLAPGSDAYAENVGTPSDVLLNLGIPQGDKGDTGAAAGFGSITLDVTGVPYGTPATGTVEATGDDTAKNLAISLEIPGGKQGDKGDKGDPGTVVELTGPQFAMHIDEAGDLILTVADGAEPPPLSIDENGDLIYTIE